MSSKRYKAYTWKGKAFNWPMAFAEYLEIILNFSESRKVDLTYFCPKSVLRFLEVVITSLVLTVIRKNKFSLSSQALQVPFHSWASIK